MKKKSNTLSNVNSDKSELKRDSIRESLVNSASVIAINVATSISQNIATYGMINTPNAAAKLSANLVDVSKFSATEIPNPPISEDEKKRFEIMKEKAKECYSLMAEHGWYPNVSLSLESFFKICKELSDKKLASDDEKKLIADFYKKSIPLEERLSIMDKLINNEMLQSRINILEEIKFSIIHKKYYLANNTLVTQIEGIIVDNIVQNPNFTKDEFRPNKSEYKTYFKSLKDEKIFLGEYFYDILMDKFFSGFDIKKGEYQISGDMSKNAIGHGLDLNFGTEIVFLKLLVLLDSLISFLEEVKGISKG